MKRYLSVLMVLVILFSISITLADDITIDAKGNSESVVLPQGGPYVHITKLKPGILIFNYGWNTVNHFENPPTSYWLGLYDNYEDWGTAEQERHYIWSGENTCDQTLKQLKLQYVYEADLVPGREYLINFFVRGGSPSISLSFIAP